MQRNIQSCRRGRNSLLPAPVLEVSFAGYDSFWKRDSLSLTHHIEDGRTALVRISKYKVVDEEVSVVLVLCELAISSSSSNAV